MYSYCMFVNNVTVFERLAKKNNNRWEKLPFVLPRARYMNSKTVLKPNSAVFNVQRTIHAHVFKISNTCSGVFFRFWVNLMSRYSVHFEQILDVVSKFPCEKFTNHSVFETFHALCWIYVFFKKKRNFLV